MNYITVDLVAESALETLRHIIADKSTSICTLGDLVVPALTKLFDKFKRCVVSTGQQTDYAIELLRVYSALHIRYPHTTLVTPNSLDFIFEVLVCAQNPDKMTFNAYTVGNQQLTMYVRGIHTLVTVSRFDKDAIDDWMAKLKTLYASKHILHILARSCFISEGIR